MCMCCVLCVVAIASRAEQSMPLDGEQVRSEQAVLDKAELANMRAQLRGATSGSL
jgi:hypothetical protein